ncbi:unnamed protein product [Ectocarpus sp. CCAP 1310/34]|nr:unnamed protein product [Ectocarpus sp. CCAP 1310/34]
MLNYAHGLSATISDLRPVVTKVLEPSEDLKNTHTSDEKKVCKSPKRYT